MFFCIVCFKWTVSLSSCNVEMKEILCLGDQMQKASLQTTVASAFIVFIAIPIVVTSILLSNAYKKTLHGNYANQIESSVMQLKAGIDNELKRVSFTLSVVANDKELMNLFEKWNNEKDSAERFSISTQIDKQLNYIFSYNSDVNGLIVLFSNGNHYYFRNDLEVSVTKIRLTEWYQKTGDNKGFVNIIGIGSRYIKPQTKSLTWESVISPKTITLNNDIERILLDVNAPLLSGINGQFNEKRRILLMDQNRQIIFDTWNKGTEEGLKYFDLFNDPNMNKTASKISRANNELFMSSVSINQNQWQLLYIEPMDEITKDVRAILSYFYAVYLIVVTSFSIYIIIFYRSSIRPVRQLVSKMKMVESGDLMVSTEVEGPKEIREMNSTFNHMMVKINALIVERDLKEKERSAEEIRALQAQIKPHFIYNTLNTIKLMAVMTKAHGIQKMIESFMKVIELTFKVEGSLLMVSEEVAYIDAYVYIMRARYGSFFEINYDVHDEVKNYKIMKMLIQPFIENAIIHGLQSKQDGLIKLSIYVENNQLIIEIYDNGVGMEQAQIDSLLSKPKLDTSHIGVNNVKRRIALTYGEDYTVSLTSVPDHYTNVVLKLPIITDGGL